MIWYQSIGDSSKIALVFFLFFLIAKVMVSNRPTTDAANSSYSVVKIKTTAVVKLDENNFFSWKSHTLANLCGYELLDYIESPVNESDSHAVKQDQLLLGWLFSALSPSILSQVAAYVTSYDVWKALQNLYNTKSRSHELHLQNELSYLKKGGLLVDQYLAIISKKVDEVRDVGIVMDDEEIALFALNELHSLYDAFVTAIIATSRDISFSKFKGLLKA